MMAPLRCLLLLPYHALPLRYAIFRHAATITLMLLRAIFHTPLHML